VFQGMHQERCDDNYEHALIGAFTHVMERHQYTVFSRCFSPPLNISQTSGETLTHWADYSGHGDHAAYALSTDVPDIEEQLTRSMQNEVWGWVDDQLAESRDGVFVGCSNGGVAAAQMALYVMTILPHARVPLLFLSGLPADQQMDNLQRTYAHEPGRVLFTRGSGDHFWSHDKFYKFACQLLADVKTFDGRHTGESKEMMQKLGKRAAKQLLNNE